MSRDYVKVVLAAYEKKKISGELSPNLINPTPGNIREECLAIYGKDDKTKDDEVLRLFFGQAIGKSGYFDVLENSRAEKFKQVPKVLNGKVPKPGLKYVELLAWLIDFAPRPITLYNLSLVNKSREESGEKNGTEKQDDEVNKKEIENYQEDLTLEQSKGLEDLVSTNNSEKEMVDQDDSGKMDNLENYSIEETINEEAENNRDKVFLFKKWSLGIAAALILAGFLFFPRYMTWKGDRYEWLIFNTEKQSVVAINWDLLLNFRKVKKDTLTEYSIGKLYYLKEKNDHDVFTMGGKHPLLVNRNLRPLSKTILDSIRNKIRLKKQMQGMMSSR